MRGAAAGKNPPWLEQRRAWVGGRRRKSSSAQDDGAKSPSVPQVGEGGRDRAATHRLDALGWARGGLSRGGRCAPGAARPHESEPEGRHYCPKGYRDATTPTRAARPRRPRPGALCTSQSDGTAGRPAPRPRPGPARRQPMGARVRAASARSPRGAGSEREKRTQPVGAAAPDPQPPPPPPSPPPPPPPGSGVLSQPESPVLRPGSGEGAR